MPWVAIGVRREVQGEREAVVQEGKWGVSPLNHLAMAKGRLLGVVEGQDQLWYKVEPMEISGRGQKWHFGKVPEGVL